MRKSKIVTPVYTQDAVIQYKDIKIIVDRNVEDSSDINLSWTPNPSEWPNCIDPYRATFVAKKIHRLSIARLFGE
jgi:hypothetical protein